MRAISRTLEPESTRLDRAATDQRIRLVLEGTASATGLAFHDALVYANQREQFGKAVADQPLVVDMLTNMVVNVAAAAA